jgi:hypothetical protein
MIDSASQRRSASKTAKNSSTTTAFSRQKMQKARMVAMIFRNVSSTPIPAMTVRFQAWVSFDFNSHRTP